jgi:predicted enzyme related to lactoylglutathione lyase
MSEQTEWGTIAWTDLTVANADGVRSFYESVVGWKYRGDSMGGYTDFTMLADGRDPAAGGLCFVYPSFSIESDKQRKPCQSLVQQRPHQMRSDLRLYWA